MNTGSTSRRDFLRTVGVGAIALAGAPLLPTGQAWAEPSGVVPTQLSEHLLVYHGPINVGIVRDGAQGPADRLRRRPASLPRPANAGRRRRSSRSSSRITIATRPAGPGVLADGGAARRARPRSGTYFDKVAAYWNDPQEPLAPLQPASAPPDARRAGPRRRGAGRRPDASTWGPAKIRVLATPGHTDGSVSYLVEVDGQRVVFCGDAIYDEGQLWELYSLQKGTVDHRLPRLPRRPAATGREPRPDQGGPARRARPLARPRHERPAPRRSTRWSRRLDACYDKYVAISALRHYFPKMFTEYAGRKDHMPIRPGQAGARRACGTSAPPGSSSPRTRRPS